ncbi:hypothetical protein EDD21DRAFT_369268 [Dissophora ornata]|nr:hypothetical protein EDD21DRAFT_369268 [Dissophora ornata]
MSDKLAAKEAPNRVQRPAMTTSVPNAASNVRRGSNTELTYEVPTALQERLSTEEGSGVRRSRRVVFKPLEFWKGEKLVFGKSDSTPIPVPVVKAVVHAVPTAEVDRKLQRKRRDARRPSKSTETSKAKAMASRKRQKLQVSDSDNSTMECEVDDSQSERSILSSELEELDDGQDMPNEAEVVDHATGNVARRVLAEAHDRVQYQDASGGEYQFHRGLEDDDTISTGIVRIPAGGVKPNKNAFVSSVVRLLRTSMSHAPPHVSTHSLTSYIESSRGLTLCHVNRCTISSKEQYR